MADNCPVCKTVLSGKKPTRNANFSTYAYDCPCCGKFVFKFSESVLAMKLNYGQDEDKMLVLSHNIRKRHEYDSEVCLDGNLVDEILKGTLPTPAEQKDILIRWIGNNMKALGDYVRVNKYSIVAIMGARTVEEFYIIFDHLKTKGVVKNKTVVGGGDIALMDITLTYSGWEYYEELKRRDTDKRKSFMGIESVPKEQIDKIHGRNNDGNTSMEWDVFICHASEDKGEFVEPLANALIAKGRSVWYDRFQLKLGDSLWGKINEGLVNSRYGVVVLSKSFFNKEWPQKELDGLAALELNGRKVILPIWHEIDIEEVNKYSPILASRLAAQSSDSLESIVKQIENVLNESSTPQKPTKNKRKQAETKKATPSDISNEDVEQRINEAIKAVGLSDDISYVLVAYPTVKTQIEGLFESRKTDVVKLIDEPPELRYAGFDISTKDRSKIINGELRRVVIKQYKLLEVWRDGMILFVVDGAEGFLCWGNYDTKKLLRINTIALIESTYLFHDFVHKVYKTSKASECRLKTELLLRNLPYPEYYALPKRPPGSVQWYANHEFFWAQNAEIRAKRDFDWNKTTAEKATYDMVSETYGKFGAEYEFIPYVKEIENEKVIDVEQLKKVQ